MWSSLPDVPWHIGYTKKDEDDPRRHKSRCVYNKGGKCYCPSSERYISKCFSSAHCNYYSEDEADGKAETIGNMYVPPKIDYTQKKEEVLKRAYLYKRMSFKWFSYCVVCRTKPVATGQKGVKKCPCCGMYYVKAKFADVIQSRYKIVIDDLTEKYINNDNNHMRDSNTVSNLIVDSDFFDKLKRISKSDAGEKR